MNQRFMVSVAGLFLLLLVVPVFAGGGEVESSPAVAKQVKGDLQAASQAWALINEGALVIDVRRPGEFDNGHIQDAINIEHTDSDALAAAIGEDLSRPVVFYCGSGRRAELAKLTLEESGYTGIFNASGYEALLETQP